MWRMLPGIAHLHLLFVAGMFQRHGYGVRLMRHHHEQALAEEPATRLFTLHCLRDSHWAMRFYKHQGYALYEPGDEGRITDLVLWIDACRRHDNGWPLRADKALFYKAAHP
jgi:ribosomal protein S18 acetylase RimI-like enzyme